MYDNDMDIMSGGAYVARHFADEGLVLVGTAAVNRYASGWIPPKQVHVYQGGTVHLTLQRRGQGTLMLAIPSGQDGLWLSVGFRDTTSFYDVGPAAEGRARSGVEVYVVDQRPVACGNIQIVCLGVLPMDVVDRMLG